MTSSPDLDKYWGVRLTGMHYDCAAMSVTFDLYWTMDAKPCRASLVFRGVSACKFTAEKIISSEVVELISLEHEKVAEGWRVSGELSNYEFTITCAEIVEAIR